MVVRPTLTLAAGQLEASDPFARFWAVLETAFDQMSNPVAFAAVPLDIPRAATGESEKAMEAKGKKKEKRRERDKDRDRGGDKEKDSGKARPEVAGKARSILRVIGIHSRGVFRYRFCLQRRLVLYGGQEAGYEISGGAFRAFHNRVCIEG